MTIRKKIFAGFFTMIIITCVACALIFMQVRNIDNEYSSTLTEGVPQLYAMSDVRNQITLAASLTQSYLLNEADAVTALDQSNQELQQAIAFLTAQFDSGEGQSLVAALDQTIAVYLNHINETIQLKKSGNTEQAMTYFSSTVVPARNNAVESGQQLDTFLKAFFNDATHSAEGKVMDSFWLSTLIVGVATFIGILNTYFLQRNITHPLHQLQQAVHTLAAGDLRVPDLYSRSGDEISELMTSFNTMRDTMKQLIFSITTNANHLSDSAHDLKLSTAVMTEHANLIAVKAEHSVTNTTSSVLSAIECATAMDETTVAIHSISEAAQILHSTAENTAKIAHTGEANIHLAKTQMQAIYSSTKETTHLIEELSKQSQEIEQISRVITSIADQTNLLALNASIEAARAGEHGKGFAVVADEVRKLAEQSNGSAGQIVGITHDIQTYTQNVAQSVSHSLNAVEHGVEIIDTTGTSFENIFSAINEMNVQIEEVSTVTQKISATAEEVSASIQEVASRSQFVADDTLDMNTSIGKQMESTEEITHVSISLSKHAENLRKSVDQFSI